MGRLGRAWDELCGRREKNKTVINYVSEEILGTVHLDSNYVGVREVDLYESLRYAALIMKDLGFEWTEDVTDCNTMAFTVLVLIKNWHKLEGMAGSTPNISVVCYDTDSGGRHAILRAITKKDDTLYFECVGMDPDDIKPKKLSKAEIESIYLEIK